jgi:hypothetical protein
MTIFNLKNMSDVIYKLNIQSPNQYYLNNQLENTDIFINGVIINIANVNYIVTTYLPTDEVCINCDDINFNINKIYRNFLLNLSIFELSDKNITGINVYGNNNFYLKLDFNNKKCIKILNETCNVDISSCELTYELFNQFDFLPSTLLIKINVDDCTGIDKGCAVVKFNNKRNQLLGVVSHIETDYTDKYVVYIIPLYVILRSIKNINNCKLTNLWLNIDENNMVTNINTTYKSYSAINVGDTIDKINNEDVKNGKIYAKEINMYLPVQTYLWYNQCTKKSTKFNVLINQKNSQSIDCKTIDDVLAINFDHDRVYSNYAIEINGNAYNIEVQGLSYELLDFMISKDIYIDNNMTYMMFEQPYGKKIKNLIVTNHDIFRDVTLSIAISENNDIPLKIKLLDIVIESNEINRLWQLNDFLSTHKKKYHKNDIPIKLIDENNVYDSIIKIL